MTEPFSIVAPTASADGYGSSAEALVLAAGEHGADIQFIEHDWRDARFTDPALMDLVVPAERIPERDVLVVYFLPFALSQFRSAVNLHMTMWETDRLPDFWARAMGDMADGVIVPSEHCAQVVRERVDRPVAVVPFGTDPALYGYHEREPRKGCVFLMAGLLHYRKGVEFALRAFREEFTAGESVHLILKTRLHFLDAGSEVGTLNDDRVLVQREDFTRQQMAWLYQDVDCFLAPSRGEGSGLTPRDAMATGLPVILTDWGGLSELADERYTYPVPVDCLEPAPEENSSYVRAIHGGGDIGNFARPSVPALRARMRSVYEDREAAFARGRAAADWVRRQWTWEHCAWRWLEVVDELTALTRSREAAA